MNKFDKKFDEKLIEIENPNPAYREKYEKENKKMFENRINLFGRVCLGLLIFIGILFLLYFMSTILVTLPKVTKSLIHITYPFAILGALLSIIWIVLLMYLIISSKTGLRINFSLIVGIGMAISFFLTVVFTFIAEYPILHMEPQDWRVKLQEHLAITIFFMLVFLGLYLILRVLYRLEFKTCEKLLEIELHLAELSEKLNSTNKS